MRIKKARGLPLWLDCFKNPGDTYFRTFKHYHRLGKLNYCVRDGNRCGLSNMVSARIIRLRYFTQPDALDLVFVVDYARSMHRVSRVFEFSDTRKNHGLCVAFFDPNVLS